MSLYVKYLVSYDIADNKIRKKFFDSLKDLGLVPVQKSVFYGDLKQAEVKALNKLSKKMIRADDSCLYFPCHLSVCDIKKCEGFENFLYDEPDGSRSI